MTNIFDIIANGNIISAENRYFEYLFLQLKSHSLLPTADISERLAFQHCIDALQFPDGIIPRIKNEFGSGFERIFQINSRRALLIRNIYSDVSSLVHERTGVYFSVLGCILDHMIDNGSDVERKMAVEYLNRKYCSHYLEDFGERKTDSVIDELFEYIGMGLRKIKKQNIKAYEDIVDMIYKAIESELFVSGEDSQSSSLTDKSVLFVVVSLKIMTADLCIENDELFEHIAYAIQIIDDICDVYEDRDAGHDNPILTQLNAQYYKINAQYYKTVIDDSLTSLSEHMEAIELLGNTALANLMHFEISEWCMSCKYIRDKVWENGGTG